MKVEPQTLSFRRPFTVGVVKELLRITVDSSEPKPFAFKVKTTAPKQYCVRPNSGYVMPGYSVEVQVLLQVMAVDPPADFKCRDKFLVQCIEVGKEQVQSSENSVIDFWAAVEKERKDEIQEMKIRVQYLPPLNNSTDPAALNDTAVSQSAVASSASTIPSPSSTADFSSRQRISNAGSLSPVRVVETAAAVKPQTAPAAANNLLHSPQRQSPLFTAAGAAAASNNDNDNNSITSTLVKPITIPSSGLAATTNINSKQSPAKSSYASVVNTATSPPPTGGFNSQKELQEARDQVKNLQALVEKYQRELSSVKSEFRQRPNAAGSIASNSNNSNNNNNTSSNNNSVSPVSPSAADAKSTGRRPSKQSQQLLLQQQEQEHLYPATILLLVALVSFLFGVLFF